MRDLEIPILMVSTADAIAIRQNGGFSRWQRALRDALEALAASDDDVLLTNRPIEQLIADELREGQESLRREIEKSSFLSAARSRVQQLSIGALSALLLAPIIPPAGAVASGTLAAAIGAAWDYRRYRRPSAEAAVLNHYLLFEDT
jgi:hypothetical protein